MKSPVEPSKDDCCNSGCNPCVFDVYEKQLKLYQKYLESGETSDNNQSENGISQLEYTTFILMEKKYICESHVLLAFKKLRNESESGMVWWNPGHHFLLKYISPNVSCTRAYTPIKLKNWNNVDNDFYIIVRVYKNGLVSNFLNCLNVGSQTLWRGPYGSYEVTANKFDRLIMITHGTGIAPFLSIIQQILNNEDDMTKVILYYCVKNVESILFREELYSFKEYWNFTYNVFISNVMPETNFKYQEPIKDHKLEINNLILLKPYKSNDQFLICGAVEFMKHFEMLLKNENILSNNIKLF